MSENAAQGAGYSIVLASLRGGSQLSVAAAEMARMFQLDFRVAEQIIRRAPIIVFKDMTDEEVQAGRAHLLALLRFGLDFRITRNPPINYPKVNWPSKPDYDAMFSAPPPQPPAPASPSAREATVQLLCPCCGSTLRLRLDAVTIAADAAGIAAGLAAQQAAASSEPKTAELPAEETALPAEPQAAEPAAESAGAQADAPAALPAAEDRPTAPVPVQSPLEPIAEDAAAEQAPAAPVRAMALAEAETDVPFSEGAFNAVPVDDLQEDAEFSVFGGAPLMDRIVFGRFAPLAAGPESTISEPAGPKSDEEQAGANEENLVEVETNDASLGLDDLPEEGVAVMPVEAEPAADAKPFRDEVTVADEELQPWTGSARKYKAKDKEAGAESAGPGTEAPEPSSAPEEPVPEPEPATAQNGAEAPLAADEVTVADEELVPWTGSARKYKADSTKVEKIPEPAAEKPLRKAIGDLEDLEDVPEIDLAGPEDLAMGKALVADVAEKDGQPGLEEGLEDVPDMKPVRAAEAEPAPDAQQPISPSPAAPGATKLRKIKRIIKPGEKPPSAPPEPPKQEEEKPAADKPSGPVAPAAKVIPKVKTIVAAKPAIQSAKTVVAAKPASAAPAAKIKRPSGEVPKKPATDDEEGDGEYSVFLSKIVSSDRQRKAVELLAELKGISSDEAEKLTKKMIIPVVKGVGKEEAEQILEKFKQSKISGRITRKK